MVMACVRECLVGGVGGGGGGEKEERKKRKKFEVVQHGSSLSFNNFNSIVEKETNLNFSGMKVYLALQITYISSSNLVSPGHLDLSGLDCIQVLVTNKGINVRSVLAWLFTKKKKLQAISPWLFTSCGVAYHMGRTWLVTSKNKQ